MTKTEAAGAPASTDALEIRDSRTGKSYTAPIADGVIRANDLRQIKVGCRRFRPDELRPGVHEHGVVSQRHHVH